MNSTQCLECRHFRGNWTCSAFPTEIPYAISSGGHDHEEPYPGDGGILFEQAVPGGPTGFDELLDAGG